MGDDNTKTDLTVKKQKDYLFKKGQSGNPSGRPEGSVSIVEGIKRKLMEIEPENKKTYLELFLNSYFRKAIKDKDSQLMRDLVNRIDGMPKQTGDFRIGDLPKPLLENVLDNNSPQEATETQEEN